MSILFLSFSPGLRLPQGLLLQARQRFTRATRLRAA